jgi:uncharacterized PurR-regulated membrane protein YhhQ (DUF165 family)
MAGVVALSNVAVQYPVEAFGLADILTWGALTYPLAFLVTDLVNRRHGANAARTAILVGFAVGVALSVVLATPRIAFASGTAFLVGQLVDVAVFNRLRERVWWLPPVASSVAGSLLDTALFFSLAFATAFAALGAADAFATEVAPLLGMFAVEAPRWVSWALGDLAAKLVAVALFVLPYRVINQALGPVPVPAR